MRGEDAPISIGIVFDTSGSMSSNGKREGALEAVTDFIHIANPKDEFFVITAAVKPEEVVPFTNSLESIQSRLMYTAP